MDSFSDLLGNFQGCVCECKLYESLDDWKYLYFVLSIWMLVWLGIELRVQKLNFSWNYLSVAPVFSSIQCCQRERYGSHRIIIPFCVIWFSLSLSLSLSVLETFLYIFGILKFHEMGFVFTLLSNLRTGFFLSLCKYFSLSIPLLLPFLPASPPQLPPDRTPLTFLPSNLQASHICILSFTSFYCAKGGDLLLPQVRPFPRALDPFLSPSQHPTPISFSIQSRSGSLSLSPT